MPPMHRTLDALHAADVEIHTLSLTVDSEPLFQYRLATWHTNTGITAHGKPRSGYGWQAWLHGACRFAEEKNNKRRYACSTFFAILQYTNQSMAYQFPYNFRLHPIDPSMVCWFCL